MPNKPSIALCHPTGRPLRIMVVDDYEAAANSMSWTLELLGHDVVTCYNGFDAISASMTFQPDFILLDIFMPGMNGLQTCGLIRNALAEHACTIVAHTAWSDPVTRSDAEDAGFDHYLVKPVRAREIEDLIRKMTAH